ncbi:MAG: ATP-binding cassette domain-containing protein, partial [Eubacteriales bacterium]
MSAFENDMRVSVTDCNLWYGDFHALKDVSIEIPERSVTSLIGPSGCGKSTLLHLLGTLDKPDKGQIALEGRRIDDLPSSERDRLRNGVFGFIFQFYHLLPELTALENVL